METPFPPPNGRIRPIWGYTSTRSPCSHKPRSAKHPYVQDTDVRH